MNEENKVLDNKCPGCGAPLFFNGAVGKWKCNYCDGEYALEDLQKYNNASSVENNVPVAPAAESTQTEQTASTESSGQVEYVSHLCQNCGAEIVADEQTAATFCVYCGNTAILKNKLSGTFAPDKVIPFKTEKKAAIDAFVGLSKGRPLMPKGFNNKENIEKIRGIYIPFWLYDFTVAGTLNCKGERVTSWTSGNTRYTKTDYYNIIRGGSMELERIPIDASTRFDNDIMNSIEPFDYKEMVPYNHAYLSGFLAERYDDNEETTLQNAAARAKKTAETILYNDATGYTAKIITENTLIPQNTKREYAMLPVWMVNVKYGDKMHIFAMNGQTGEFIGNIPLDKKKAVIIGVSVFAIVFLLVILISFIMFKVG